MTAQFLKIFNYKHALAVFVSDFLDVKGKITYNFLDFPDYTISSPPCK